MAADNFPTALDLVLRQEGGFVDHPRDPGGATNMGITIGTLRDWRDGPVSSDDVRILSMAEAAEIYRARYWDCVKADQLPAGVDYAVFDGAVNSGPARAIRWLQTSLGTTVDGDIGPLTLAAVSTCEPANTIRRIATVRLSFLRDLSTWNAFGTGWKRRVDDMERDALAMAQGTPWVDDDQPQLMRRGDGGTPVRDLQVLLNRAGHDLVIDGDFGPKTEAAVMAFQTHAGLVVDGIVGPNTREVLNGHIFTSERRQ